MIPHSWNNHPRNYIIEAEVIKRNLPYSVVFLIRLLASLVTIEKKLFPILKSLLNVLFETIHLINS